MIHTEIRHYEIIKSTLSKYPYSFYAFGSRAKGNSKRFSDLDLCFAGDIPIHILAQIEGDFDESDLPYKVDIVDLQKCSEDFRKLIRNDIICVQANSELLKIEQNTFKHFRHLPQLLGYEIKHMHGCEIIDFGEAPGLVYGADFKDLDEDRCISDICNLFGKRAFSWWLGPSARPYGLGAKLAGRGFVNDTTEYAMTCKLEEMSRVGTTLDIQPAERIKDFIAVLSTYDVKAAYFYENLDPLKPADEKLFIGYEGILPVTIGMVCFDENLAGIFFLLTIAEKRGRGYGTAMMQYLMEYARGSGKQHASLIASSEAGLSIYKKLGFVAQGLVECYEWR